MVSASTNHSTQLQYLVDQLKHPLPILRFNAARALGELADPQAIDFLLRTVQTDKNANVREAARIALAELGVELQ